MEHLLPNSAMFICAFFIQWFSLHDIMDGMRARRLKCGTPLGRMIDEGTNNRLWCRFWSACVYLLWKCSRLCNEELPLPLVLDSGLDQYPFLFHGVEALYLRRISHASRRSRPSRKYCLLLIFSGDYHDLDIRHRWNMWNEGLRLSDWISPRNWFLGQTHPGFVYDFHVLVVNNF